MFLYLIYMLVRCIKRVCLPNIIMNQDIVPEILQFNAKPKIIFKSVNKILNDEEYKNKMIQMLKNVKQKLSTSGAAHKTAEIIVNNI